MVSLGVGIIVMNVANNMKAQKYLMIPLAGKENDVCHAVTLQFQN